MSAPFLIRPDTNQVCGLGVFVAGCSRFGQLSCSSHLQVVQPTQGWRIKVGHRPSKNIRLPLGPLPTVIFSKRRKMIAKLSKHREDERALGTQAASYAAVPVSCACMRAGRTEGQESGLIALSSENAAFAAAAALILALGKYP